MCTEFQLFCFSQQLMLQINSTSLYIETAIFLNNNTISVQSRKNLMVGGFYQKIYIKGYVACVGRHRDRRLD